MARKLRFVKLVRSEIAQFLEREEGGVTYMPMENDPHFIEALRKKLMEECAEYLLDPGSSEIADIVEVCKALADLDLDVSWESVEALRIDKLNERGGFTKRMGMYVWTDPGESPHG